MESFPLASLTPKQTVIMGELLRQHPHGQVLDDHGKPIFVSDEGTSKIMIPLTGVETNGHPQLST